MEIETVSVFVFVTEVSLNYSALGAKCGSLSFVTKALYRGRFYPETINTCMYIHWYNMFILMSYKYLYAGVLSLTVYN